VTIIDSRARDLVEMFFAQCEPVAADARARWAAANELDRVTVLQLRAWAVDRAIGASPTASDKSPPQEVQEWRMLTQWLVDHRHLDHDH